LPDHFGPPGLAALGAALARLPRRTRLLVQYVPHAFGFKAMNLPFCLWLASRRRHPVWVMFHEVAFPIRREQSFRHNILGCTHRLMAWLIRRASARSFVSIPAWQALLERLGPSRKQVEWLPVPSTLPTQVAPARVAVIRQRVAAHPGALVVGHFGTSGPSIAALLSASLPPLIAADGRRVGLLVGRGSESFAEELSRSNPSLRSRLIATGGLPPDETAAHLAACDVLLQPYPDGVCGRRTSLMAGLALGVPTVTTEGPLSEPLWRQSEAVWLAPERPAELIVRAADQLLRDHESRTRLGARAAALYEQQFALSRTIHRLRSAR
jgi:glycosyltransferase involved in cell wall biosynthesis